MLPSAQRPRRGSDAGVRAASLLARAQLPPGQGNVALVNLWWPGGSMQSMFRNKILAGSLRVHQFEMLHMILKELEE